MALFCKYPIEQADVRFYGRSHHPRILARLQIGNQYLNVIVPHLTTLKSNAGYLERNNELAIVADEIKSLPAPKLVVGDLNCGPWSSEFQSL